jgi:hypothetical protein
MVPHITTIPNGFSFSRYQLLIEPVEQITLPSTGRGNTLRGAFGITFRRTVCPDIQKTCEDCVLREVCSYALIFDPMPPAGSDRLSRNANIPRPFVIKPPLDKKIRYGPGEILTFELVIIGRAQEFLPHFIVTFSALGESGIGPGRGKYRLVEIRGLGAGEDGGAIDFFPVIGWITTNFDKVLKL